MPRSGARGDVSSVARAHVRSLPRRPRPPSGGARRGPLSGRVRATTERCSCAPARVVVPSLACRRVDARSCGRTGNEDRRRSPHRVERCLCWAGSDASEVAVTAGNARTKVSVDGFRSSQCLLARRRVFLSEPPPSRHSENTSLVDGPDVKFQKLCICVSENIILVTVGGNTGILSVEQS